MWDCLVQNAQAEDVCPVFMIVGEEDCTKWVYVKTISQMYPVICCIAKVIKKSKKSYIVALYYYYYYCCCYDILQLV